MVPCKPSSSLHLGRRGVHSPAPPTRLAEPSCVCPVPSVRSLAEHLLGVGHILGPHTNCQLNTGSRELSSPRWPAGSQGRIR